MIWVMHELFPTGKARTGKTRWRRANITHGMTRESQSEFIVDRRRWANRCFWSKRESFVLRALHPETFGVSAASRGILKLNVSIGLLVCQSIFWCDGLFSQTMHDTNYTGGKSIPTKLSAWTNNKMIKVTGFWLFFFLLLPCNKQQNYFVL